MRIEEKANTFTHLLGAVFALTCIWAVYRNGERMADDHGCHLFYNGHVPHVPVKHCLSPAAQRQGKGHDAQVRPYKHLCHDSLLLHSHLHRSGWRMDWMGILHIPMACGSWRNGIQNRGYQPFPKAFPRHLSHYGLERPRHCAGGLPPPLHDSNVTHRGGRCILHCRNIFLLPRQPPELPCHLARVRASRGSSPLVCRTEHYPFIMIFSCKTFLP